MSVTSPNNVGEGGERKKKGVYLSRIWLIQSGQSTQSLQMAVVCSPWFWCVHRHKMPMKFNICLTVYLTFNYWMIIIECWMKALIRRKLLHGVFKLVIFIPIPLCTQGKRNSNKIRRKVVNRSQGKKLFRALVVLSFWLANMRTIHFIIDSEFHILQNY